MNLSILENLQISNSNIFFSMAILAGVSLALLLLVMLIAGLGTYAERKISADIQARIGPNRVGPLGLLQFIADGIKMLLKEDLTPKDADKFLFYLAPLLAMLAVFAGIAVLPFSDSLILSNLNMGILYLVAISSLVSVAIFLGGYASNSKWSLLGAMRGAAQMISFEIPVTFSILSVVILTGSLSFQKVVNFQGGLPHHWIIFHNPFTFLAFFVFFTGALAEANRAPFDLPEAESELVSGYHTEYSGMRFAFFALAEYMEVFILCAVSASLFLGGFQLPFQLNEFKFLSQVLQVGVFLFKSFLLFYLVIWIRWTLPRLRVDQLMSVCWKYLTPISFFNLLGVCLWIIIFDGDSISQIIINLVKGK